MSTKPFLIRRILVPIDFSEASGKALEHAITMANLFRAEIDVLHVTESFSITAAISHAFSRAQSEFEEKLEEKSEERLLELCRKASDQSFQNVRSHLEKGKVHKTIIAFAEKSDTDIIIMGTHGHGEKDEHLLGSNTTRVMMNAPCPVISVQTGNTNFSYRNILLPIDNSSVSRQKVRFALELAKKYHAIVHVLGAMSVTDPELQRKFELKINQVGDFLDEHNITNTIKVVKGNQLSQIVLDNLLQINPDLVLVMTEQEGGSLFLGNAAQHIINHSKVPVMTVRPTEGNPDTISVGY
jgi:nucleotide-binding universal stress UspA family protein